MTIISTNRLSRPQKLVIVLTAILIITIYSSFTLGLRPEHVTQIANKYAANFELGLPKTSMSSTLSRVQEYEDPVFEAVKAPGTPRPEVKIESTFSSTAQNPGSKSDRALNFWTQFSRMLSNGKPRVDSLKVEKVEGWVTFSSVNWQTQLKNYLNITEENIKDLKDKHSLVEVLIREMFEDLPFERGTRGIVTTAGWNAEAILTTSLRMLRMSGSRLPVEIWYLDDSEYDEYMCSEVWPELNAKCLKFSDFLGIEAKPGGTYPLEVSHHFQMKILSMLFSTFEQVLFLDCDLFPVTRPDSIFVTEPFISSGYILWPDYWARTNSEYYGQIIDRPPADYHERASTESGAMLVDKSTHAQALILAAYYNRYGPEHYYWLFSQGAIGHGDKDTYVPANEFFHSSFYQVDTPPRRMGYRCDGNERAIASAQTHPYDDYMITKLGISRAKPGLLHDAPEPRILFIHGNLPKYDAPSLLNWNIAKDWDDQQRCDHGKGPIHRLWGEPEFTILRFGFDLEKVLWDQLRWFACTHGHKIDRWTNGASRDGFEWPPVPEPVCPQVEKFYAELLPEATYDPKIPDPNSIPDSIWGPIAG